MAEDLLFSKEEDEKQIAPMPVEVEHNGDILVNSSKNEDPEDNTSLNGAFFTPHPPGTPKDSAQRSPRRLKNKNSKRFERRIHPVQRKNSKDSSSDEDKLSHNKQTYNTNPKASKLPPLLKQENDVIESRVVPFCGGENTAGDHENLKHNTFVLKPLSPIKDQKKLVENFKSMQSLEREKLHTKNKAHLKPLKPSEDVPNLILDGNNGLETKKSVEQSNNNSIEDLSESTLTSVSSDGSSNTDSDSESSLTKDHKVLATQFYPEKPNVPPPNHHYHRHHNSLSLSSVRDYTESTGGHSDSEAMRRGKMVRRSTKELWNKAKIVTLLPRVPASKARDRNSNFVKEELEKYLPERKLMIFIGTWNMHGEKQLPMFVDDLLLPECCQFMQDLYVIGTQESTPSRKEWEIKLQEALGPTHVLIYSCAFGVLHLAMYLRRELVWFCSAVEQATVATRPGHMIKTKGAVGLTLSIFGTSFLFINSHFTAHERKWKERVGDYRLIRKTLSLPLNYTESPSRTTDITSRFHQVFWFGDFNFRVEERQGVVEKYLRQCQDDEDPKYDELIAKDQMTRLMSKGGVFEHFKECKINFAPTYRFDINPDDPGNYSSVRVPSWTDRIVYRSSEESEVKPLHYDCCTSLNISDHRPVFGIFEATIKPIKDRVAFTGVHFVRDVYIEANRRRAAPPRNQNQTTVCTIL